VSDCLLVMQRQSWEQGVTAAALIDSGRADLLAVLLADAVARQLPDGRLAELDSVALVNCGAIGELLHDEAVRTGDAGLLAASRRQREWLLHRCPRASDGTLFHLADRREVWADTVYMVVPALAAYGATEASLAQFAGHRARLRDPDSGLWHARWDEDEQRVLDRRAWGTANGWVAAALVRTLGRLPGPEREPLARELRDLLDCCLPYRRSDGLFGNLLDDPDSFSESSATAMLAYSALRGSTEGWLPPRYAEIGASLLEAVAGRLDEFGRVTGSCAAPDFQRPGFSAEAQAFALMADAAHVRWLGLQRGG
jgi:unsaturated rhamnogalacturonyl hydrolase